MSFQEKQPTLKLDSGGSFDAYRPHYSVTNLILAVIISGYVDSLVMLHILVVQQKFMEKSIQGQNSKYFFFFPLRKMMLLVRHRWPIFHFPWCCYPLSGGYLLQPKICIIPLFFKITDLHLHTVRKSQIVSKNSIKKKITKVF